MKNIRVGDGKVYKVPVILIISDAVTYEQRKAIYDSFFKAVERIYGVGWGRKDYQWVYVDEWNTHVVKEASFDDVYPVGIQYCQQYDEMLKNAEETGESLLQIPKSAFPLLYLLQYAPTTQLAEHDVPSDEQWKLMAHIIRQFHHRRAWIDAVFVDAVNHDQQRPQDSYDASAIPETLENLPVTIFNSPAHLTELLINNDVFLSVTELTLSKK